jgi:hypothetical protein
MCIGGLGAAKVPFILWRLRNNGKWEDRFQKNCLHEAAKYELAGTLLRWGHKPLENTRAVVQNMKVNRGV